MNRKKKVEKLGPNALVEAIDLKAHPALSSALASSGGTVLRKELEQLLGRTLRDRAPRRQVKRIARLIGPNYDEVVLLKDISSSGVRLLVRDDTPVDLRDIGQMTLAIKLRSGVRKMPVVGVRFCGRDGQHIDLGFRFTEPSFQLDDWLSEIRSNMFSKG